MWWVVGGEWGVGRRKKQGLPVVALSFKNGVNDPF
jgi:hypothetical protein